ncbi:proline--tRNA ligase, partial [Treponema pallidum subsp. pallidum]
MSAFFAPTLRSAPADATIASHQLLMRAGYVRKIANGLFAYLPLGLRVRHKIEAIIREELEAIGCLECTAPVVTPAELWKESGRWYRMG